jgi:hypothetical protein
MEAWKIPEKNGDLRGLEPLALPNSEQTALARQAKLKLRLTLRPGTASLDTRVIRGFT